MLKWMRWDNIWDSLANLLIIIGYPLLFALMIYMLIVYR